MNVVVDRLGSRHLGVDIYDDPESDHTSPRRSWRFPEMDTSERLIEGAN